MREAARGLGGHSTVVIGAQPAWDPQKWTDMLRSNAVLRQQIHRARNKAVEIEVADPLGGACRAELAGVLKEWLRGRALPPLHFLAEPAILDDVTEDQMVLVARRGGRAVAFAIASPVGARRGYLLELLARSSGAPNGTSELLIDAAMRYAAASDASYMTLGLVALARAADRESAGNPLWLQWLMRFARAHANRFYRFRGLEYFRAKLAPEAWEPVYAISNERRFSMSTMYALGGAFSGISPCRAIGIGAMRAVRAEWETLGGVWDSAVERAASRIAPRQEAG
jgi:phosphatidylglycerol lysyltransferase